MSGSLAGLFNTQLTPVGEQLYRQQMPPQASQDYDMRGAWAQLGGNLPAQGAHFTDQFKKPNHPTFSAGSQYSTPVQPGGEWSQTEGDQWNFRPTQFNLDQIGGPENLQRYFDEREPGSILLDPFRMTPDLQSMAPSPGVQVAGVNIEDYVDHPSSAAQVPPDTMQDSPRYWSSVDTGTETTPENNGIMLRTENRRARDAQTNAILRELTGMRFDRPGDLERHKVLTDQLKQLEDAQASSDSTRWMQRQYDIKDAVPSTADTIMRAVQERQRLGRQSPQSPAPLPVPEGFLGS